MNQARLFDVSRWWPPGSIDWDKVQMNFDGVLIGAAVGTYVNPYLQEQVDQAVTHGIPFHTFFIPDVADGSMPFQARFYQDLYGVRLGGVWLDDERPYSGQRPLTSDEGYSFISTVEALTSRGCGYYGNQNRIQNELHSPQWIARHKLWVAAYYYRIWPFLYSDFDSFLAKYPGRKPTWVMGTQYEANTVMWQFTKKLDARRYCATPTGPYEADGTVSTMERDPFMDWFAGGAVPPPPQPQGDWYRVPVAERYVRDAPNNIAGNLLVALHTGDLVLVNGLVNGVPGMYGKVEAWRVRNVVTEQAGYVYMNSLVKA